MKENKSRTKEFSETPLDRCHLRWFYLFDKVLKILFEKDPILVTNIRFTLYKHGLSLPFEELNPSDETLRKTKAFHEGQISCLKLTGKQKYEGKRQFYPILISHDYLIMLSAFQDFPRAARNPYTKVRFTQERLPEIRKRLVAPRKDEHLPDKFFRGFSLSKKELIVRLLAHFYGPIGTGSIRKYLKRAERMLQEDFNQKIEEIPGLEAKARFFKSQIRSSGLDLGAVSNWVNYGVKKEAFRNLS